MSTATPPTVEEIGAIVHGLSEAGSFDAIERGVAEVLRDALPPLGAGLAVRRAHATARTADWRCALAADILARLDGRRLGDVTEDELHEAMNQATEAATYALAAEALEEVGR
jgi:hypothetical protein